MKKLDIGKGPFIRAKDPPPAMSMEATCTSSVKPQSTVKLSDLGFATKGQGGCNACPHTVVHSRLAAVEGYILHAVVPRCPKYFHAYAARVLTVIYLSGTREEKLPTMVFTMGAVSPRMPSMMPTSELDQPYADWVKMGKPSI